MWLFNGEVVAQLVGSGGLVEGMWWLNGEVVAKLMGWDF
jgi:hypothetical protein